MIALWWLACGRDPGAPPPPPDGPVAVRTALAGPVQKRGGSLVVQVDYDPAGQVEVPVPAGNGLTFRPDGEPRVERIGGRDVVTQKFVFEGASGSFEIEPLSVGWTGPDGAVTTVTSGAVFVDLGVPPPRPEPITDIVEPGRVRPIPWLMGAAVLAVVVGGLWVAFRPRRVAVVTAKPPPPPDVVALSAWEAVRADAGLPLEAKAVRLAELFRVYVEAVLGFEATARTTGEIVAHLESLAHLPEGNPARAKRLLRAVDRVKFAEEHPGGVDEWLAELDADLRGFVASTRPVGMSASPSSARRSA